MRWFVLLLPVAGVALAASGSAWTAGGTPASAPCHVAEGSIIGFLPALVVSPCNGGVRAGGVLHRGDQIETLPVGQVTFTTDHVLSCTLRNGRVVLHPKPYVVLRLKLGTIFCKQMSNRRRWKFLGPNVDVTIVPHAAARTLAARSDDGDVVLGMVAKKRQTIVTVDEGAVRASARGASRVVHAGGQVVVNRGRPPGPVRPFTPTATQLQTLATLEQDVTTTTAADLHDLLASRNEHYAVVIAENAAAGNEVAQQLAGNKLLKLLADAFRADPYGAALKIKSFAADVVVVAGTFDGMSAVVDELTDPDYQSVTGKQLLVVFVPIEDKAVLQTPRVTTLTLGNDHVAYSGPCPATITFTAQVAYEGTGTIFYTWRRSDGAIGPIYSVVATGGKPITISTTWAIGSPGSSYQGWEALKILGPRVVTSNTSNFSLKCSLG